MCLLPTTSYASMMPAKVLASGSKPPSSFIRCIQLFAPSTMPSAPCASMTALNSRRPSSRPWDRIHPIHHDAPRSSPTAAHPSNNSRKVIKDGFMSWSNISSAHLFALRMNSRRCTDNHFISCRARWAKTWIAMSKSSGDTGSFLLNLTFKEASRLVKRLTAPGMTSSYVLGLVGFGCLPMILQFLKGKRFFSASSCLLDFLRAGLWYSTLRNIGAGWGMGPRPA
mmetsp:Transcript_127377/g.317959  ORF Transcript_127377/g.317959 Transcript_127377/m.317959 type:complete len:225 (+) Transcript_127377:892-1566(+)